MFVYCNENIAIMAPPRCGSTSLYKFFHLEYHSLDKTSVDHWKWYAEMGMKPVLILRNPYDRVSSAYNMIEYAEENGIEPKEFFGTHSCPYMWQIRDVGFQYIDFYELDNYLPTSENTIVTKVKRSSFNYIENPIYSAESLKQEYIDYKVFLNTKPKMGVDEWKYLTQ